MDEFSGIYFPGYNFNITPKRVADTLLEKDFSLMTIASGNIGENRSFEEFFLDAAGIVNLGDLFAKIRKPIKLVVLFDHSFFDQKLKVIVEKIVSQRAIRRLDFGIPQFPGGNEPGDNFVLDKGKHKRSMANF